MLNSVYTYSQHGWMLEQDPEQLASRLLFILTFSAAIPVTTNLFKELNKGKTLGIFLIISLKCLEQLSAHLCIIKLDLCVCV